MLLAVVSLAAGATALFALEDHRPYKDMKVPECTECHRTPASSPTTGQAGTRTTGWPPSCRRQLRLLPRPVVLPGLPLRRWDRRRSPRVDRPWVTKEPPKSFRNPSLRSTVRTRARGATSPPSARTATRGSGPGPAVPVAPQGWSDGRPWRVGQALDLPPDSCQTCHPNSCCPRISGPGPRPGSEAELPTCQACHADGDICLKCHSAKSGLRVTRIRTTGDRSREAKPGGGTTHLREMPLSKGGGNMNRQGAHSVLLAWP